MAYSVLKCTPTTIKKMQQYYKTYILASSTQHSIFTAKSPQCTITAYASGKVLFQGKQAETEAARWHAERTKPSQTPTSHNQEPRWDTLSMIGSDEVGTGDYFGPIVVAAAYMSSDQLEEMKTLGLKDSKKLTDAQIQNLAKQIKPKIIHHILTVDNQKYNASRHKGITQGKMKALMHNQVLGHVTKQLTHSPYDGILIDQFCEPDIYFSYLKGQSSIIRDHVYFRTKAESLHLSVAAASILARDKFLQVMDQLSDHIGMTLPKGAGQQVDEAAARLLQKHGHSILEHYAKLHFANTNKAKKIADQS